MGDITCAKCGEPWEAYGVYGDFEPEDAKRFLKGEGCPACHFGTRCTRCDGTGKEAALYSDCRCRGDRRLHIFMDVTRGGPWMHGYVPNMRVVEHPRRVRDVQQYEHRDGIGAEAWCDCPDCFDDAPPCSMCHGTGTFSWPRNERLIERFMHESLDETDDPDAQMLLLQEGGLL